MFKMIQPCTYHLFLRHFISRNVYVHDFCSHTVYPRQRSWCCSFTGRVRLDTQQTQLVSLFSPQYVISAVLHIRRTRSNRHTLPSSVPSCCRRLRAVIPAWTAYVPPRGAAAACSGSSSAAGCSRCCSAEGRTRQTMMEEGKGAITLQIKPV